MKALTAFASVAQSRHWLLVAYVVLSLSALAVLSIGEAPFTVDLANHATRLFIECNPGHPILSRMWRVEYGLIPNLAIDLINQPLCGLVDPMTVVRGALVLSMAGILLLVWRIHLLLHGAPNAFVLLAPAMSFNIITVMGYLNYLIGAFLFILFVWSVLRFRIVERHPALAILLPNLFGTLLFFCHVFALGLAGLFLFGLRMHLASAQPLARRIVVAGLWNAAAFAVPLLLVLLADRSGVGFEYTLAAKIRALWAVLLYSSLPVAAALVGLWSALFIWSVGERHLAIHPRMRVPLALLGAFSILIPSSMLHAVDLDSRSLVATAFLAVAAIGPTRKRGALAPAAAMAAAAVAVLTVLVQAVAAVPRIMQYQREVAEFRSALRVVQPFDAILIIAEEKQRGPVPRQTYLHLPSYATRERGAFNPLEFSGEGMQPMKATPSFACLDVPAGGTLSPIAARQLLDPAIAASLRDDHNDHFRYAYLWNRNFDLAVYFHFGAGGNPFPDLLRPIHEGSFFTFFDVRTRASGRPHECGTSPAWSTSHRAAGAR